MCKLTQHKNNNDFDLIIIVCVFFLFLQMQQQKCSKLSWNIGSAWAVEIRVIEASKMKKFID